MNVVHAFGFRWEIVIQVGACLWIQKGDRAFDTINVVHASGFRREIERVGC